jgi:hypothetical protein
VIWRHTLNTFGGATAFGTNAADDTSYDDATASPGILYYYWVTATNAFWFQSAERSGHRVPPDRGADGCGGLGPDFDRPRGSHLDRFDRRDVYRVYRDTDADPAGAADLGILSSGTLDTFGGARPAVPLLDHGHRGLEREHERLSAATPGLPPAGGSRRPGGQLRPLQRPVALTWTDGTGETGYGIWRNVANDSATATFVDTAAANAAAYDDVSATAGVDYYYMGDATNTTSASMGAFQASGALGRRLDPKPER